MCCTMAVWGKSLVSTHMVVGSSNSCVENAVDFEGSYVRVCESLFSAHMILFKER